MGEGSFAPVHASAEDATDNRKPAMLNLVKSTRPAGGHEHKLYVLLLSQGMGRVGA